MRIAAAPLHSPRRFQRGESRDGERGRLFILGGGPPAASSRRGSPRIPSPASPCSRPAPGTATLIHIPMGFARLYVTRKFDWNYQTEAEPELGDRSIYWPRGRVIGGSGSVNGLVFPARLPARLRPLAQSGARGWSYEDCLPAFRRRKPSMARQRLPRHRGPGAGRRGAGTLPRLPRLHRGLREARLARNPATMANGSKASRRTSSTSIAAAVVARHRLSQAALAGPTSRGRSSASPAHPRRERPRRRRGGARPRRARKPGARGARSSSRRRHRRARSC